MKALRWTVVWLGAAALLMACNGRSSELRPVTKAAVPAVASAASGKVETLTRLARQEAADSGDPHVRSARYVETTRSGALRVLNAGQAVGPSAQIPITLVVMTGRFTAYWAHIPYGGTFPTGTVLSFTYAAAIGHVLDLGLDSTPVVLSPLGPVGTLDLG